MKLKYWVSALTIVLLASCGGGSSVDATASSILGLALDDPANPTKLYVANADNQTMQTLNMSSLTVATLAGTANAPGTTNGTGAVARFYEPFAVTRVSSSEFYVVDTYNHGIRKLTDAGVVTTLAGTLGTSGSADGTGTAATFYAPKGIANDGTNLYVADTYNSTIRQIVISTGAVTTLAGSAGTTGTTDGTGSAARFNYPFGLTVTGGNVYVADTTNQTIRKVTSAGVVTTLAGTAGTAGSADATGTSATFNYPAGVVSDGTNLFVADSGNHTIRKIVISSGVVTTLAGTAGSAGATDGTGSAARFSMPIGLTIDNAGNLYVTDQYYTKIRKVVTSSGVVTTINATF